MGNGCAGGGGQESREESSGGLPPSSTGGGGLCVSVDEQRWVCAVCLCASMMLQRQEVCPFDVLQGNILPGSSTVGGGTLPGAGLSVGEFVVMVDSSLRSHGHWYHGERC